MQTEYEGVKYYTSFSSSIERHLIKLKIKKRIGRFINKHYRIDPYLLLCRNLLKNINNPIVIDVGANIGTTTLPLAKQFPNAHFIAIEPHPIPGSKFIKNCQLNNLSNVSLITAAITPQEDLVKIYTCPSNSGGHRITGFEGRNDVEKLHTMGHIATPSISLNSLFAKLNITHCDILKIDVEGFEYQVLHSIGDALNPEKISVVVTEYGPEGVRKAGKKGWDIVQKMLRNGYACKELGTEKPIACEADIPILADHAVTDFIFYSNC